MSIQRCEYCQKNIDTDFDAEHFDCADDCECINEEADNHKLTEFDFNHN